MVKEYTIKSKETQTWIARNCGLGYNSSISQLTRFWHFEGYEDLETEDAGCTLSWSFLSSAKNWTNVVNAPVNVLDLGTWLSLGSDSTLCKHFRSLTVIFADSSYCESIINLAANSTYEAIIFIFEIPLLYFFSRPVFVTMSSVLG